jgi:signal transduction histidine kinase
MGMADKQANIHIERENALDLYSEFQQVPLFNHTKREDLACLGEVEVLSAEAGADLKEMCPEHRCFWILLEGEIKIEKIEREGRPVFLSTQRSGDTFGEVPLLTGKSTPVTYETVVSSKILKIDEPKFWSLMAHCPVVRTGILVNMAQRLQSFQAQALHREKLVSLGTLAAGLMHELNNPGTAAKRAASQLRENLVRLQYLSLRFCDQAMSPDQIECMRNLQEHALRFERPHPMSTLEQADAEEALADWLSGAGIPDAWKLAPSLHTIGLTPLELSCAAKSFSGDLMADALGWLDSLVSSIQLVGTVEESIARVSELVMAVKKYAHDDKSVYREVDVHDSIESTLMILGHKFRQKSLTVHKCFEAASARIQTQGTGLSQVWTNLLDNAIDASSQGGTVTVHTWQEDGSLIVGVMDNGTGISLDNKPRIFEPFFTTKQMGEGTGLGLGIVHRIVVESFRGSLEFTSEPGKTEFLVKLPLCG